MRLCVFRVCLCMSVVCVVCIVCLFVCVCVCVCAEHRWWRREGSGRGYDSSHFFCPMYCIKRLNTLIKPSFDSDIEQSWFISL